MQMKTNFHMKGWMSTRTHFEKEAKGNPEMAYFQLEGKITNHTLCILPVFLSLLKIGDYSQPKLTFCP